jgi:hypothetical protein
VTLICTVISNLGIIQASDSNLSGEGVAAGTGPKVFRLGFADGALAVAGAYSVGGERMDRWMPRCIRNFSGRGRASLGSFAHDLGQRLTSEMTDEEKSWMSLTHIAGYTSTPHGTHPEMFFVRNVDRIDSQNGNYVGANDQFHVTEDFWKRDYLRDGTKAAFREGGFQRYFNGFPPGRIAFFGLTAMLRTFFQQVWTHPDWQFREPRTLDKLASLVELEIHAVGAMFRSSDYPAPYIGGDVQIEVVSPPPGAALL